MSPVYLRDLGFQRNQPENREGLSRTRRRGRGHLGNSGVWQNNEGDNINLAIYTPFQQDPQTRGLERYGSSSSAPPTLQRFIPMEHGQQEVQPGSSLGRAGASCQKIYLKEIDFKDLMVINKGWNPTRKFRLPEARENRIRENQATMQAVEEQLTQTGPTQIPSGSQRSGQISSPMASHHSEARRSVAKSHHSSQFQEVSRRRQGNKGKNKTSFNQRKRESDPIIQKMLDLVKEVHRNQK
ncbi:hypothetical protein O181_064382 [Austropuccinia psidii MF-1]|uniref:Uncharacterized protein n=1 Tax=Austropuccinia psidii MF-1 TaxID=1389203 RepID=A0A9Q3I293_9BASI|nr:hypothetical protein [Austropuccinia psidii MF-1]